MVYGIYGIWYHVGTCMACGVDVTTQHEMYSCNTTWDVVWQMHTTCGMVSYIMVYRTYPLYTGIPSIYTMYMVYMGIYGIWGVCMIWVNRPPQMHTYEHTTRWCVADAHHEMVLLCMVPCYVA